jgi:flagellar motility protein MotE (MotC chaperone)
MNWRWLIVCYLFGCLIAFPLGAHNQHLKDKQEIETAKIQEEKYKNAVTGYAAETQRLAYANALLKNSLDSIRLYEEKSKLEALAEIERRKSTKEWKIFENCLEKANNFK